MTQCRRGNKLISNFQKCSKLLFKYKIYELVVFYSVVIFVNAPFRYKNTKQIKSSIYCELLSFIAFLEFSQIQKSFGAIEKLSHNRFPSNQENNDDFLITIVFSILDLFDCQYQNRKVLRRVGEDVIYSCNLQQIFSSEEKVLFIRKRTMRTCFAILWIDASTVTSLRTLQIYLYYEMTSA